MHQLKQLLIDQLQDLYHAETQLTTALPKMAKAAHHPKLKEAFQKHLTQTEGHVERLRQAFASLGEDAKPKTCKAMIGLIQEGEETMGEGAGKDSIYADLALIAAAQRVEHYEISAYGTARSLARQAGDNQCARLLSHTLGEEESADHLLTSIADPLLQQAKLGDLNGEVNLENTGRSAASERVSQRRRMSEPTKQAVR
jgi:Mn-containing catalase